MACQSSAWPNASGSRPALPTFQLTLDSFAQQVRTLLPIIKNGIHAGQRALGQACGNLLVIDLFSTHAKIYVISGNLTSPPECDII